MTHEQIIALAAAIENVEPARILAARLNGDNALVVVVDNGIAGCPKHIYANAEWTRHNVQLAYRNQAGEFVARKQQDADGLPEMLPKRAKPKRGK